MASTCVGARPKYTEEDGENLRPGEWPALDGRLASVIFYWQACLVRGAQADQVSVVVPVSTAEDSEDFGRDIARLVLIRYGNQTLIALFNGRPLGKLEAP